MPWREFQHAPAFSARYDGECAAGDADIYEGDSIIMTDDGPMHSQCVDHDECPDGSTCHAE